MPLGQAVNQRCNTQAIRNVERHAFKSADVGDCLVASTSHVRRVQNVGLMECNKLAVSTAPTAERGSYASIVATVTATSVPYLIAKLAVAANTAFIETFYGDMGGAALAAEADTLHWEFLWLGSLMGGLRAVSIVVGSVAFSCSTSTPDACRLLNTDGDSPSVLGRTDRTESSCESTATVCTKGSRVLHLLFRGELMRTEVQHSGALQRLSYVYTVSWTAATVYLVAVTLVFWFSEETFFIAGDASRDLRFQIQHYFRGFAWGIVPTGWVYLNGQFGLGLRAAGIALIYDGVLYAACATVAASLLYPSHGAYGLGLGMAIGAWIAWFLNVLHVAADPVLRRSGAHPVPIHVLWRSRRDLLSSPDVRALARLGMPLAASNMTGLMQTLVVAALVSNTSSTDAAAYSIANAYFDTASIAVLAASSVVSASLAGNAPAELKDSDRANTRDDNAVLGTTDATSAGRRRRKFAAVATGLIFVAVVIVAVIPLIAPDAVAQVFGARVYAFGKALTTELMPRVRVFSFIASGAFVLSCAAMLTSATLHGWQAVWLPTIANAIAAAVGIGMAVGLQRHGTMWVALGNVVTACVQLLLLLGILIGYRRRYLM
jgi:hypothetical protein